MTIRALAAAPTSPPAGPIAANPVVAAPAAPLDFTEVYEEIFPFVWRTVRRLGVDASAQEDVCQDVFVVVHRRLSEFRGHSSLKTWIFGIVIHVVQTHRRSLRRKDPSHRGTGEIVDPELLAGPNELTPDEVLSKAESVRVARDLLQSLDEEKRVVLILAELEEMPVTEIAQGIGVNINTVYARLRAARQAFAEAVRRHHARNRGDRNE